MTIVYVVLSLRCCAIFQTSYKNLNPMPDVYSIACN